MEKSVVLMMVNSLINTNMKVITVHVKIENTVIKPEYSFIPNNSLPLITHGETMNRTRTANCPDRKVKFWESLSVQMNR
jgi:hypothetical protein